MPIMTKKRILDNHSLYDVSGNTHIGNGGFFFSNSGY